MHLRRFMTKNIEFRIYFMSYVLFIFNKIIIFKFLYFCNWLEIKLTYMVINIKMYNDLPRFSIFSPSFFFYLILHLLKTLDFFHKNNLRITLWRFKLCLFFVVVFFLNKNSCLIF